MDSKIRTRFAPSPTGFVHVGSLRTALYNYLFAKAHNGDFLLRIEDTDQNRKVEGAVENIQSVMQKFGLYWDNNPLTVQSERLEHYRANAETLIKNGHAYYCFCTPKRLEEMREQQQKQNQPPLYDGHCRTLAPEQIEKNISDGIPKTIRFLMPKTGETVVSDEIRGDVVFRNDLLDDQIIIKSDGFPTYHLASVVDDHDMDISHVIRGEEWLPSTPKHLALYHAFGWDAPTFAHLPLLLNRDKSKLSKRQGDVAVEDYLAKGYLPEALLNFVLLLGWNPKTDQEIFNFDEMVTAFDLKKINKSGAVFDTEKLDWLNGHYIRSLQLPELARQCIPYYKAVGISADVDYIQAVVKTEQQRITRLDQIVEATSYFFTEPNYAPEDLIWKKSNKEATKRYLEEVISLFDNLPTDEWNEAKIESTIKIFIDEHGYGMGDILWPVRFALSGRKASPSFFEIATVIGKEKTLSRLEKAAELLAK